MGLRSAEQGVRGEMNLSGILLATDGSEDSALSAKAAVSLSARTGAELHLVHAWYEVTLMAYPAMKAAVERHDAKDRARSLLEEEAEIFERDKGTVADTHLRRGHPAEEVVGLTEESDADLVVLGSRGIGPIRRLVTGSTSEGAVNLASRPTLVVRGGGDSWPPSRVVVGEDSSGEAEMAGYFAARMGWLFGAPTVLVRAFHHHVLTRPPGRGGGRHKPEAAEGTLSARVEALKCLPGTRPGTVVEVGDATSVIQNLADVLRAADGPVLVYGRA